MSSSSVEPADLLDLKLLPAWVKESSGEKSYEHYTGEEEAERPRGRNRPRDGGDRGPRRKPARGFDKKPDRRGPPSAKGSRVRHDRPRPDRPPHVPAAPLEVAVRFLPHPPVLENVIAQIKSESLAYSVFALARLFLEKPQRYDVHLAAKSEKPIYQLGENGAISMDREFLETNAFRFAGEDFYKSDVTQSDPIKGNFTSVARCRLSGTVLGPTNHHAYQPRLRTLYEQRFSRRMSFQEYQGQVEISTDPAAVEHWKEEARNVTTWTTLREETPATFANAAETERHFRQTYLPGLERKIEELTIDGIRSRQLPDRKLHRHIEDAWSAENRSPSNIMQELAKQLREAGLQIFRQRRGMLFVSSVRPRPFVHEETSVSPQVKAIFETVAATPRINRKDLAEKLIVDAGEEAEARKMALASDLHWLVSEGYVIEFNDGSLDLPRVKAKTPEAAEHAKGESSDDVVAAVAEAENQASAAADTSTTETL